MTSTIYSPDSCDLVPQRHNYDCGVAALATVARIQGKGEALPYDKCQDLLQAQPGSGTDEDRLREVSENYLTVQSAGENTYDGGLAIACIWFYETKPTTGSAHLVVFLGVDENGDVHYYCPHRDRIVQEELSGLELRNTAGTHNNWTINFEMPS